jgi:hypothetical protein
MLPPAGFFASAASNPNFKEVIHDLTLAYKT